MALQNLQPWNVTYIKHRVRAKGKPQEEAQKTKANNYMVCNGEVKLMKVAQEHKKVSKNENPPQNMTRLLNSLIKEEVKTSKSKSRDSVQQSGQVTNHSNQIQNPNLNIVDRNEVSGGNQSQQQKHDDFNACYLEIDQENGSERFQKYNSNLLNPVHLRQKKESCPIQCQIDHHKHHNYKVGYHNVEVEGKLKEVQMKLLEERKQNEEETKRYQFLLQEYHQKESQSSKTIQFHSSHIEILKQKLNDASKQITDMIQQESEKKREIEQFLKEMNSLKELNEQLKMGHEKEKKLFETKTSDLSQQLIQVSGKIEGIEKIKRDMCMNSEQYKIRIEELTSSLQNKDLMLESMQEEKNQLWNQMKDITNSLQSIKQENMQMKTQFINIYQEQLKKIDDQTEYIRNMSEENNHLKKIVQRTQQQLEQMNDAAHFMQTTNGMTTPKTNNFFKYVSNQANNGTNQNLLYDMRPFQSSNTSMKSNKGIANYNVENKTTRTPHIEYTYTSDTVSKANNHAHQGIFNNRRPATLAQTYRNNANKGITNYTTITQDSSKLQAKQPVDYYTFSQDSKTTKPNQSMIKPIKLRPFSQRYSEKTSGQFKQNRTAMANTNVAQSMKKGQKNRPSVQIYKVTAPSTNAAQLRQQLIQKMKKFEAL